MCACHTKDLVTPYSSKVYLFCELSLILEGNFYPVCIFPFLYSSIVYISSYQQSLSGFCDILPTFKSSNNAELLKSEQRKLFRGFLHTFLLLL